MSYQDTNGNYEQILDSDFESSFDGWEENGGVDYILDSGRLRASVRYPWEGVRKPLSGVTTVVGETLTVKINFDKSNTQSNVRLYLPEYNSSGTVVNYNVLTDDLQSGYSEHTLTFTNAGNSIGYLRIDKDNTNTSDETYFYIDHVSVERNNLEILEENNYYPFGLKHKGYNDGSSTAFVNPALDYQYNGVEFEDALGLDSYDFGARNYDPAIGRWMNIDPLAEQMYSHSPYSYAFNNPIYFFDEDGNIPLPMIINYSRISSQFGLRMHPIHKVYKGHGGVDLVAPNGSSVRAAARGVVEKVGWDSKGYGRYIVIRHADGYYSIYAHLEKSGTIVVKGDNISNGQLIATSGNTGGSTGSHLHFEIAKAKSLSGVFNKNNKVDPQSIYDLDQKLHGPKDYSHVFETGFDLFWKVYGNEISSGESSSNSSSRGETRTPLSPVNTITPVGPVFIPTPKPTPGPIIPVIPGQTPTPEPFLPKPPNEPKG